MLAPGQQIAWREDIIGYANPRAFQHEQEQFDALHIVWIGGATLSDRADEKGSILCQMPPALASLLYNNL